MINEIKGQDYQSEVTFWDSALAPGKREPWIDNAINPETRKREFPPLVLSQLDRLRNNANGKLKVLDVGCGPLSPLAWGVESGLFELTATDILADIYIELLEKYHISYPVKPVKCSGEELDKHYPQNSFDLVYSRNALDHTQSPLKCVRNMHDLLKTNGTLVLSGFVKEGTSGNWDGLHQWDLVPSSGNLMCYDKTGQDVNLIESLHLICVHESQVERWYHMAWKNTDST